MALLTRFTVLLILLASCFQLPAQGNEEAGEVPSIGIAPPAKSQTPVSRQPKSLPPVQMAPPTQSTPVPARPHIQNLPNGTVTIYQGSLSQADLQKIMDLQQQQLRFMMDQMQQMQQIQLGNLRNLLQQ